MVNLEEYLEFVKDRKSGFDARCNALRFKGDLTGVAALYMDVLTSNFGESWETTELLLELDDIFETLKNQGVKFAGNAISERGTDKNDKNVILQRVVREQTTKSKAPRDVTKKHHVHAETISIKNFHKTNAYGIPSVSLSGTYHPNFYDYVSEVSKRAISVEKGRHAIRVRSCRKEIMDDCGNKFKMSETVSDAFFKNINTRMQYGLAGLYELDIDGDTTNGPAGLLRLDFDVEEQPVCTRLLVCLRLMPFIKGHVSAEKITDNTISYVKRILSEAGIALSKNCKIKFITNAGSVEEFVAATIEAKDRHAKMVEQSKHARRVYEQNAHEYEESLEQARLEEMARKQADRFAERQRKKKEAEEAKVAAKYAEYRAQVEAMKDAVASNFADAGMDLTSELLNGMLEDIRANGKSDITTQALIDAVKEMIRDITPEETTDNEETA